MCKTVHTTQLLVNKTHWMFDMDGTLTHAIHDFDAIRAQLGLPDAEPILESIARLPAAEAAEIHQRLDTLEFEIAEQATAQPYSRELLQELQERGCRLGIVTRNGKEIAKATLTACGLAEFFTDHDIISRDCCAPKPNPEGVQTLLERWSADAAQAVMIGDYLFDLEAGRGAGVTTVHLDVFGHQAWPDMTDIKVDSLLALSRLLTSS